MVTGSQLARDVAESLLSRSNEALISGDFQAFLDCFHLPYDLELFDATNRIETVEDLRAVFGAVHGYFTRIGATQLIWHLVEASQGDYDTILVTHESRLLRENELLQPPYPVYSVVGKPDGIWRIVHRKLAIVATDDHGKALATRLPRGRDTSSP